MFDNVNIYLWCSSRINQTITLPIVNRRQTEYQNELLIVSYGCFCIVITYNEQTGSLAVNEFACRIPDSVYSHTI